MRGFTLLELLLAIFIFSVVIVLTYGAYNMSFKVIHNASANSVSGERARVVLDRISEDLLSIYVGDDPVFIGETESFNGYRGDSLTFSSTAHLRLYKEDKKEGWTTLSYRVEEEDDGLLRLLRLDVPYRPGVDTDLDEEEGLLLCDGLREVQFTYADADGESEDDWELEDTQYPATVAVVLGFPDQDDEEKTVYYRTTIALGVKQ